MTKGRAIALACLIAACFVASPAFAQTLPTARISSAPLVSPSSSDSQLGSGTTHTNSLTSYSYLGVRPVEIVELADALNNDADLIFEHVRNNIRTEFRYGLAKGALGALIDRSGTSFDQAHLLVELLREAGYTANYVLGSLSLNQQQFADWTGITNAQGACTLLSHGGIPATVNGVTDAACSFSSSTNVSSIVMRHTWVAVTISGSTYVFDPSYKAIEHPTPINFANVASLDPGDIPTLAMSGASTGTQSGGPWVRSLNLSGLETALRDASMDVVEHIQGQTAAPAFDDLAGLASIPRAEIPTGGWRLTSHPVGAASVTWTEIPNQYRTKLVVDIEIDRGAVVLTEVRTIYTDEFYGRRFQLRTNFDTESMQTFGDLFDFQAWLEIDDVAIATFTHDCPSPPSQHTNCVTPGSEVTISLSIDHPYAANSGGYVDHTVERQLGLVTNASIIVGLGSTSMDLAAKWGGERLSDRYSPSVTPNCIIEFNVCEAFQQGLPEPAPLGDFTNQRLLASWLGQFVRASEVAAAAYGGRVEMHDVLGLVSNIETTITIEGPDHNVPGYYSFFLKSQQLQIDAEPTYSVIAVNGESARRRALAHSVAAIGAILEGSSFEQQQGAVDSGSAPARIAWGLAPPDEDPSGAGSRRVYDFTNVSAANRPGLMVIDGVSSPAAYHGNLIGAYVDAGFQVTGSSEAMLGPGARLGPRVWNQPCSNYQTCGFTHEPTTQRGGAVIATRLDGNGDPIEIAHVMSIMGGRLKGGGGDSAAEARAFDPEQSADVLRDRFQDRSAALGVDLLTGSVSYTTPTLDSVGAEEPYGLAVARTYMPGASRRGQWMPIQEDPFFEAGGGGGHWTHSLDFFFEIGTSGSNTLGEHSAEAGAVSLVALWALNDVYASSLSAHQRDAVAALVVDWWRRQFRNNSATYSRGASSMQFVRLADGTWQAPSGNFAILTQTGERVAERPTCELLEPVTLTMKSWPVETRRWSNDGVDYTITLANGVVIATSDRIVSFVSELSTVCDEVHRFAVDSLTWPQGPSVTLGTTQSNAIVTSLGRSSSSLTNSMGAVPLGLSISNAAGEDWTFEFETGHGASAARRPSPLARLIRVWEPTAPNTQPGSASLRFVYDGRGYVREAYDAVAIQTPAERDPHSFQIAGYGRGSRVDPLDGVFTVYYDADNRPVRFIDELGHWTEALYDGRGRVTERIFPECDRAQFAYDLHDNPILFRRVAKPIGPHTQGMPCLAAGSEVLEIEATWHQTWNRPLSITDARANTTDFTYYESGNGRSLLQTVLRPSVGGSRPTYSFAYNSNGLRTSETDPTGRQTTHAYNSLGELTSTTVGAAAVGGSALNLTTNFTYTSDGDVAVATDPRGNAVQTNYDAQRRVTLARHHNGSSTANIMAAQRTTYDLLGRAIETEGGTAFSGTNVTAWLTTETRTYTPTGQVATVQNGEGELTRTCYDDLDRPYRTVDGVGRARQTLFNALAQSTEVQGWWSASLSDPTCALTSTLPQEQSTRFLEQRAYTPNGLVDFLDDANNNRSDYTYDGFDRPMRLNFPVAAMGQETANTNDYEEYGYDDNGNRTATRLRSGETITVSYDALDRQALRDLPGGSTTDVYSAYDLSGRPTSVRFASTSGDGIVYGGYDAAGRLQTEAAFGRTLAYQYDAASNRTRLTWPDPASNYLQYDYDAMNRVSAIRENGAASGAGVLATYAYDALSRRGSIMRGNGTVTTFSYDNASRLTQLAQDLSGVADDQTLGFSYTDASQIAQRTAANDNYNWIAPIVTRSYTRDGLNRYATVGGTSYSYDTRGNLINDGSRRFCFDLENHLTGVAPASTDPCVSPTTLALSYDPMGRPRQTIVGSTTTQFVYDGDRLSLEYNGSGSLLRRYAFGPGVDEPLVWYEGSGLSDRRYLIADHQGSVIAENGASTVRYSYGPYGEPNSWSGARFRYTGQAALPEAQLYHYKARVYDPVLGRFLQTDPVGYEDDLNLYGYARNDPVNRIDPAGLDSTVMCRSVAVIGQHCFTHVTNSDGSSRALFSYGPQNNSLDNPGQLVETAGDPRSETRNDDLRTIAGEIDTTHRVNLNDHGFDDDSVVAAGQRVDRLLGTPADPGPTRYDAIRSGEGRGNSDAATARLLEQARPGSSRNREIRPDGYAPGWRRPDVVGTAPPAPRPPPPPRTYDVCRVRPGAC